MHIIQFSMCFDFNSQPHKEADFIFFLTFCNCHISIHSLTRRLTRTQEAEEMEYFDFNSQPHKEADGVIYPKLRSIVLFQFTASQGG